MTECLEYITVIGAGLGVSRAQNQDHANPRPRFFLRLLTSHSNHQHSGSSTSHLTVLSIPTDQNNDLRIPISI